MRTPHRGRALRPAQRTVLAAALATAFGSASVQAATVTTVTNLTQLQSAIATANQVPVTTPGADCRDQVIALGDGINPFSVGVPTPLTVTCPHLTLQGMGANGYGAVLTLLLYGGPAAHCAIESTAPVSVLDLEISGFHDGNGTNTSAAI